ncbi:MAG: hypothetical protein P8N11_12985 [Gammaproteobacteria bacterium]|jgi:hypothetical protein|nr:hypothetical protein [Gammaproteobacteria bacterium]
MAEKIADFELKHKGSSFSRDGDDNLVEKSNWESEGDMEIYGAVYGSLTVTWNINDPDVDSGEISWAGEGFLPDGSRVIGFQEGTWKKDGKHEWELSMRGRDSKEGNITTESHISLETLTWSGSVFRA